MSTLGPQPTRPRRFATLASVALLHHTGSPRGCVCATTTARTTWLTMSNRRSRSSGLRVPRASCERPKGMGSRSVSSVRDRRISCGCGASRPSKTSAWPCSRSSGRTTNSGCWRSTTIGVQPKCDAISTGWTRPRRSDYLQTTVQEPWGATPFVINERSCSDRPAGARGCGPLTGCSGRGSVTCGPDGGERSSSSSPTPFSGGIDEGFGAIGAGRVGRADPVGHASRAPFKCSSARCATLTRGAGA